MTDTIQKTIEGIGTMKEFTENELSQNHGRGGKPAYVARDGNVYDVSASSMWKEGRHMNKHTAGADLTADFANAPHGTEVFERVEKVGILKADTEATTVREHSEPLSAPVQSRPPDAIQQIIDMHPHPILVHFPQAVFVLAPVFLSLFYILDVAAFERTAYYLMIVGLLTAPAAYISGLFHWVFKYGKVSGGTYKFKIFAGQLLIALSLITTLTHAKAGVLSQDEYNVPLLVLYFLAIPLAAAIGHAGGTIVFGSRK